MNGNTDHAWEADGLRERKHTLHAQHEECGEQEIDAGSEDLSREKEVRRKKKTVGKTPDGTGE